MKKAVSCLVALLAVSLCAAHAPAGEVTDSASRRVSVPDRVERVFAAGAPAAVAIAVLAPEKLLGWPVRLRDGTKPFLSRRLAELPELGRLTGRGDTANLEVVIANKPDVVVDYGTVAQTYISLADRVQSQTSIPVVLVDGRFANSPASIRLLGKILGVETRAEEIARYAEETFALVDSVLAKVNPEKRPSVYLARGANGLETGIEGSINTEILERAGGRNVARRESGRTGLSQVSLEQVLTWNPEMIVTLNREFVDAARKDQAWAAVRAVREGKLVAAPDFPFGWIDGPPSLNRLIGLRWLVTLFFPEHARLDMRAEAKRFYKLFYNFDLNEESFKTLLADTGVK